MAKRSTSNPDIQYRAMLIRADSESTRPGFTGYASVFNNVDSYGTAVAKGAFKKTLQERGDKIPVLWQHDPYSPIGKPTVLKEDTKGLYVDASIVTETTYGKDAMTLLRQGVPLGLSIGFEIIRSRAYEEADDAGLDWADAPSFFKTPDGREYVRVIEEVRLWEFSIVTFAANEQAAIDDVRSLAEVDLLSTLTEDLRAGKVGDHDPRLAPLHSLVAAYRSNEPKPDPAAGTTPLASQARHRIREAQGLLALRQLGITPGGD